MPSGMSGAGVSRVLASDAAIMVLTNDGWGDGCGGVGKRGGVKSS